MYTKKDRAKKLKKFIQDLKISRGCFKCGYNKCAEALQFHHIDPKGKYHTVSYMVQKAFSIQNISDEVDKCILLCSNCHFEHHHLKKDECEPL